MICNDPCPGQLSRPLSVLALTSQFFDYASGNDSARAALAWYHIFVVNEDLGTPRQTLYPRLPDKFYGPSLADRAQNWLSRTPDRAPVVSQSTMGLVRLTSDDDDENAEAREGRGERSGESIPCRQYRRVIDKGASGADECVSTDPPDQVVPRARVDRGLPNIPLLRCRLRLYAGLALLVHVPSGLGFR
jgi:hypothetical protein